MIVKLSFLDSQGKAKNKVFKKQPGEGIQAIRAQFAKYDRWKTSNFILYYQDSTSKEVVLENDHQLQQYLLTHKSNAKIWAKESSVVKGEAEEFQVLKISQIKMRDSQIQGHSSKIPNESFILNRNEPPLIPEPKSEVNNFQSIIYEQRKENDLFRGVMKRNIHLGVCCSNCQRQNIEGPRYHCLLCFAFNLCGGCQSEIQHQHPLLKIKQPDMEFKVKELQQLRDNIQAQLPEKEYGLRQEQRQSYLKQINELSDDFERVKSKLKSLTSEIMAKQDEIQELRCKLDSQPHQLHQQPQSHQPHQPPCTLLDQTCEIVDKVGKNVNNQVDIIKQIVGIPKKFCQSQRNNQMHRYQQPLRNQLPYRQPQRYQPPQRNEQPQRNQQSQEDSIMQKAHTISQQIGIDFFESMRYVKQHPRLKIDELIDRILK